MTAATDWPHLGGHRPMSGNSDSINKVLAALFNDWAGGAARPETAAPETPEMAVTIHDGQRGDVTLSIPRDPKTFRDYLDHGISRIEALLGLEAGQSRWIIPPSFIMGEEQIERVLDSEPESVKVKPDQADPMLGRLPDYARAGEIAHRISPVQALARLERLQAVGDTLRERGDAVIQKKVQQFLVTPSRVFAEACKCGRGELMAFSELFDDWVNTGMNVLSGPHGHWDRKGRWPCCLLLLQAMSVACGAAAGDRKLIAELPEINQQLEGKNFGFLWRFARSYHQSLQKLNINPDPHTPQPAGDSFTMLD
jgi:hypothetical protein